MMKIRFVIFDMGGVIVKWDDRTITRAFADKYGKSRKKVESSFFRWLAESHTGNISEIKFLGRVAGATGISAEPSEMLRLWKAVFRKRSSLDKGVAGLIRKLHRDGYRIAVITNTSGSYRAQSYVKMLRRYIRLSVTSCYVHMKKPEKRIFLYTMRKLHAKPAECVFIDDKAENVAGARRAGMHAIRFRNAAQLQRDLKKLGVKTN
jgi:epoxide hydrolase-like predicted phosphatase